MRQFNEFEKAVIHQMIANHKTLGRLNDLNNIFTLSSELKLPQGCYLRIGPAKNEVSIFKEGCADLDDEFLQNIESEIFLTTVGLVFLFRYLEQHGLISFSELNFANNMRLYVGEQPSDKSLNNGLTLEIIDYEYRPDLYRFARSRIFVSQELINYVESGYRSKEELIKQQEVDSLNKSLNYTRSALLISIIGLIFSLVFSIIQFFSSIDVDIVGTNAVEISNSLKKMSID